MDIPAIRYRALTAIAFARRNGEEFQRAVTEKDHVKAQHIQDQYVEFRKELMEFFDKEQK